MIRRLMLIIMVLSYLVSSCSKEDETPTGPGTQAHVDTISITPESSSPASVVTITGYTIDTTLPGEFSIIVGGAPAPFYLNDDNSLTFMVPLFLDSTGWSAPPAGRVDVELMYSDSLVAVSDTGLLVTPLEHAPGTTAKILQANEDVVAALENMWSFLPVSEDWQRTVRNAISSMMGGLLSEGDSSLTAIVNGTSSVWQGQAVDLELVDAILASSGVLDMYTALADGLNRSRDSASAALSTMSSPYCNGDGADMDLACQMQIYVILRDYTETVVMPTAETYNNTVGLAAGVLAISGVGTVVGVVAEIVGALLTVESFIMDKLVVATLPSHINTFTMTSSSDTIGVGEYTSTRLFISAANTPEPITVNDIITQVLATMPFLDLPSTERLTAVLLRAAQFVVDQYRGVLLQYEQTHPGTFDDIALAQVPSMVFGPVEVTHDELVQLFSTDNSVLQANESMLEWEGVAAGVAVVRAQTRASSDRAKVVNDWMLLATYTGGAFGEDVAATENRTVTVGRPTSLTVAINGLPDAADANVTVSGPDYSSGRLTATETLPGLEPGDYTVTAVEVQDSHGVAYIPSPLDTTVALEDDDHQTVTITYEPEFGNLLLTVSGLPEGLDAIISVTGADNEIHYVTADTLLDSLVPGEYDIAASEVTGNDGTLYTPNQSLQTVTVYSAETATASVAYGGAGLTIQMGALSPDHLPDNTYGLVSVRNDNIGPFWSNPVPDYPAYTWINDCYPDQGLLIENNYETNGSDAGAQGTASVDFVRKPGNKEIDITFNLSASGTVPPPPTDPWATNVVQVYSNFQTSGGGVLSLRVDNPSGLPLKLEFTWDLASSATLTTSANFSISSPYPCKGTGLGDYLFSYSIPEGEARNGADTVSIGSSEQWYLGLHPGMQVKGGGQSTYDGALNKTWGGSLTGTLTIRVIE